MRSSDRFSLQTIVPLAIRHRRRACCGILLALWGGCTTPGKPRTVSSHPLPTEATQEAMQGLKRALGYEHNPVVRLEAVEALQDVGDESVNPWIRTALLDDHPAVRFAACMAVGIRRDKPAESAVRNCLKDEEGDVRLAAMFALHCLGDTQHTGKIPTYLLIAKEPATRRHAALVLGLIGETSAIRVLARAMRDSDAGVRQHALEAMARLGNPESRKELAFMANSGVGSEEVFALQALAATGDPVYIDAFRYKLETAIHEETKLAAARGLGLHGMDDGFDVALRALRNPALRRDDPDDPPREQALRIRQLAAAALGAIGRVEALPALRGIMRDPADPRLQVSAAKAILQIADRPSRTSKAERTLSSRSPAHKHPPPGAEG